jgi:hypothetical protein
MFLKIFNLINRLQRLFYLKFAALGPENANPRRLAGAAEFDVRCGLIQRCFMAMSELAVAAVSAPGRSCNPVAGETEVSTANWYIACFMPVAQIKRAQSAMYLVAFLGEVMRQSGQPLA